MEVEKIEPLVVKSKLHIYQIVTYTIVNLFCLFIAYVVITGLMLLDDIENWIKSTTSTACRVCRCEGRTSCRTTSAGVTCVRRSWGWRRATVLTP
jgi:hypothetical protein